MNDRKCWLSDFFTCSLFYLIEEYVYAIKVIKLPFWAFIITELQIVVQKKTCLRNFKNVKHKFLTCTLSLRLVYVFNVEQVELLVVFVRTCNELNRKQSTLFLISTTKTDEFANCDFLQHLYIWYAGKRATGESDRGHRGREKELMCLNQTLLWTNVCSLPTDFHSLAYVYSLFPCLKSNII